MTSRSRDSQRPATKPDRLPLTSTCAGRLAAIGAITTHAIYDSNDVGVVTPVTVTQDESWIQRPVIIDRTGVLFIVIDETGAVESAIIAEPLDRAYDRIVLDAAEDLALSAATRNGAAVKYRKRIQLTLHRQTD